MGSRRRGHVILHTDRLSFRRFSFRLSIFRLFSSRLFSYRLSISRRFIPLAAASSSIQVSCPWVGRIV